MQSPQDVSAAVAKLYDTYPFPPDPLSDDPPPGYNWRWNWNTAYSFCTGQKPARQNIRILDAGCGSGVSTEYLLHLNPQAEVVAIDLSAGTLAVARERAQRSGVADRAAFEQLSLFDVAQLPGEFDLINSVGVLHHTADPIRGIQALAKKLAPGGIFHIFVYGALGRWEIGLMQEAIALLQGDRRGDYRNGVSVGRQLFAALPDQNRLKKRETERWSLENHRDECFADMYVHPQEIDYTIPTLRELIQASGLEFLGFSNPKIWQLERLVGSNPDLVEQAARLDEWERYRLIELLDPESMTHYEFFLGRSPLPRTDWSEDKTLLAAIPELNPCLDGWPSHCLFNSDYQIINLSETEHAFLSACEANLQDPRRSVAQLASEHAMTLEEVRSLLERQLVLLSAGDPQM
ncbi:class I SAM-dependent methyltransferase [Altericista sp. CCNU0014]|uniref:class I SAM-dependent methyltransferase n=1 Tax=Altericista sp. CCNU0014 TaxID=3082949 RepID=UPI00384C2819